jgi:hypothetical protein
MSVQTELTHILQDAASLDTACRNRWGVTATMFRTAKFVFYIATLVSMAFLVESGVDPFLAMSFAALLISGPEGLEMWLVNQGAIETPDTSGEQSDDQ